LKNVNVELVELGNTRVSTNYAQKSSRTLELSFISNEFGRVLLVKPSMFGKLEVHASEVVWRFEPITFHIGELRVKLILALHAFYQTWKVL
jgi:hypothetical protein